jgi:hypothetical protein
VILQLSDKLLKRIPRKQTVKAATQNKQYWIQSEILNYYLETGLSDNQTILMLPVIGESRKKTEHVAVTVRPNDTHTKSQLARHLSAFNWSPLYHLTSTESMVELFKSSTTSLLNRYLQQRIIYRHMAEKPWVTDEFRRLIGQRRDEATAPQAQVHAFMNSQTNL